LGDKIEEPGEFNREKRKQSHEEEKGRGKGEYWDLAGNQPCISFIERRGFPRSLLPSPLPLPVVTGNGLFS